MSSEAAGVVRKLSQTSEVLKFRAYYMISWRENRRNFNGSRGDAPPEHSTGIRWMKCWIRRKPYNRWTHCGELFFFPNNNMISSGKVALIEVFFLLAKHCKRSRTTFQDWGLNLSEKTCN